jgi:hypothetical protein
MELPHALRMPPEAAAPTPYLRVTPAKVAKGSIGLCWQAGQWDAERSLPEQFVHILLRAIGAGARAGRTDNRCSRNVFVLHPGPTTLPVVNANGAPVDLVETASLIAGLDLVITVDTLFAHLAGALRRPTWLLLKHDADWRWMDGRRDTPWYPGMRLYRQPRAGDWRSVIAAVERDLNAGC